MKETSVDTIEGEVVLTAADQKNELLGFFKGAYTSLKPGGKLSVKFVNLAE